MTESPEQCAARLAREWLMRPENWQRIMLAIRHLHRKGHSNPSAGELYDLLAPEFAAYAQSALQQREAEVGPKLDELAALHIKYDQLCGWYKQVWERAETRIVEKDKRIAELEELVGDLVVECECDPDEYPDGCPNCKRYHAALAQPKTQPGTEGR